MPVTERLPLSGLLPNWLLERLPVLYRKRRRKFDPWARLRERLFPRHASMFYPIENVAEEKSPAAPRPGLFRRQRKLAPEEIAELKRQAEAQRAKLREAANLTRLAKKYSRIIQDTLEKRGICSSRTDGKGRRIVNRVKFHWPPNINPHFIEMRVDTIHWPNGTNLDMLSDPGILKHISMNCEHRVRYKETHDCGFWYVIELDLGATGIPLHVDFEKCIEQIPAGRSSDSMLICLGQTENARTIYATFPKVVNLKVSGSPESGKSNFLNATLCWLIRRNAPWQLQLLLIDLKGGMEFAEFYKGLPHLLMIPNITLKRVVRRKKEKMESDSEDEEAKNLEAIIKQEHLIATEDGDPREAIIEDREDLPGALYWAVAESERRMKLVRGARCKTIGEYNQIAHNVQGMIPLPRIIIVIDELADVLMDEDVKDYAQRFLQNLTNRSRAVGMHVIACSQHTGRDLLPGRIQQAFRAMATFALADRYVSMSTVGNQGASKLDNPGRFIWSQGRYELEIQAPYCPNALVEQTVADAIAAGGSARPLRAPSHDVDDMEIFRWALEHNNGMLDRDSIFEEFRGRGFTQRQANEFGRRWEGKTVTIDEACYQILPAVLFPKRLPRRLMATQDDNPIDPGTGK